MNTEVSRHSSLRTFLFPTMLLFSVLGALNAGYLSFTALSGVAPICNFVHGCDLVAASPYSRIFGVPLALFGVFFYSIIAGFSLWGWVSAQAPVRIYLRTLTALGFILSLYFLYLQWVVIEAFCEYCLFSLFDASVLFILSFFVMPTKHDILEPLPDNT